MVVDAPPLCYLIVTFCVCCYPCVCGYLRTITNAAEVVVMVVLGFVMVATISSTPIITHNLLALFVSFVLLRVNPVFCLWRDVTEISNRIFGQSNRTPFSDARKTICRSTTSRQSKQNGINDDNDDDDGVYTLHAAVNEQRVSAYDPV